MTPDTSGQPKPHTPIATAKARPVMAPLYGIDVEVTGRYQRFVP